MNRSLLVSLALVLTAGSALAQKLDAKEATLRYEEGVALFSQKKYSDARVKFLEACAAQPTAKCTKNLGAAEVELGMHAEAATHFRAYLADPQSQKDPARAEVERIYGRERGQCGELEISSSPGATISIDGAELGNAPLKESVFAAAGAHAFVARLGEARRAETVNVEAGRVTPLKLELSAGGGVKDPPPPPPPPTERATAWPPPTPSLILGGIGVAGVVAGAVLHGAAASKRSSADPIAAGFSGCGATPNAQPCADVRAIAADQDALSAGAVTAYIAGGAFIGAALVWWAVAPRRVIAAPMVGGFIVQGSF